MSGNFELNKYFSIKSSRTIANKKLESQVWKWTYFFRSQKANGPSFQ